jgi:hypothetical protein
VCCSLPALQAQEGRLQKVREEVHGDDDQDAPRTRDKQKKSNSGRGDSGDDDCEGSLLDQLFGGAAMVALAAPFVLPPALLGDDYEHRGYFLRHPYLHDLPGFMRMEGFLDEGQPQGAPPLDPTGLKSWMGRLTVFESNDFRGLNRVGGQLLLDTAVRWGLQTDWVWLHERLRCGCVDDLGLGDFNVVFRFAQTEYMQMRAGLGARVLTDTNRWGFNFTYGADFFPARPLVLSGVIDLGSLGSVGVFHARASAGLTWHGWEAFVGYDYLLIGSVDLQGPIAGIRFWF